MINNNLSIYKKTPLNNADLLTSKNATNIEKNNLFNKKVSSQVELIPQNTVIDKLGKTRHFPAASKEWFNSVYSYNKSITKNIPILDKILNNLLKSYFSLEKVVVLSEKEQKLLESRRRYHAKKNLNKKRPFVAVKRPLNIASKITAGKILISKAHLKHTSDKVIVNLSVYDQQRFALIKNIYSELRFLNKQISLFPVNSIEKFKINFARLLLQLKNQKDVKAIFNLFNSKKNGLAFEEKSRIFSLVLNQSSKDNISEEKGQTSFIYNQTSALAAFKYCMGNLFSSKKRLNSLKVLLNNLKFNNHKYGKFTLPLKKILFKLYNKKVEIRIINVKNLYLNSDLFTKAIAIRLKNKNNRLLTVLRTALARARLSESGDRLEIANKDNRDVLWLNKAKNLSLSKFISNNLEKGKMIKPTKDYLEPLLDKVFPVSLDLKHSQLDNYSQIKYKNLRGIRLEAKGRLTKRSTASRAVFKVRWIGGLRNIESSYKGFSTVLLRGHAQPNVQYSLVNSKCHNGTFGIKGWIAGR